MDSRFTSNAFRVLLLFSTFSFSLLAQEDFQIAYNVTVDEDADDYDVWVMEMDGSNRRNITNHPDVAWTYHANDDKILFISDRDTCKRCYFLYEMNGQGQEIRKVSNIRLRDSWIGSRNHGKEIIINPHSSVDSAFLIISRLGKVTQRIDPGLPFASDPAFSPDGARIAFRGANKKSKKEEGFAEAIYLINSDGSNLTKISQYPDSDTTAPWHAYKAGPPRWHPSGDFVTYHSFQEGKYSLYAIDPKTNNTRKLTKNTKNEGWHDWSPDGHWLAIELFDTPQTQFHIALMNWKTREMKILTDKTFKYQQAPVFVRK